MRTALVHTCSLFGIDAVPVVVEVQVRRGTPNFTIIGLADSSVRESRDRVSSALRSSGFQLPDKVLVNLAPAEVPKEGSGFDLAIAVAILSATNQIPRLELEKIAFFGELSLTGELRRIRGAVALSVRALEQRQRVIVPMANLAEASLIGSGGVLGVSSLSHLIAALQGAQEFEYGSPYECGSNASTISFDDVRGQEGAKRALTIAAAGGHNALLIGPPGCGKSMLAKRFGTVLPVLSQKEALEVVRVQSVAGLELGEALAGMRPVRMPHHTISDVGMVGGGSSPRPGEISLAHRGVLFLDEFPEFRRSALEALRAPLESGSVEVVRAKAKVRFPCRFQLLAAMNPCPCGRLGTKEPRCSCSQQQIQRYLSKLSQPILDRIDLHIEVKPVPLEQLSQSAQISASSNWQSQVEEARKRQYQRQPALNSQLEHDQLHSLGLFEQDALDALYVAARGQSLSARTIIRVMRVARTVADLANSRCVERAHMAEALGLRGLERLRRYVGLV